MSQTQAVTLSRTYTASPEQIWKAWTDPDVLSRWYGCAPDQHWTIHRWDVTTGGLLHVSMDFDGEPFVVRGEFLEVDAPNRLRFTFGEGQTISVDISTEEPGGDSTVTVTHDGLDGEMPTIVTEGWTSSLTELADAT